MSDPISEVLAEMASMWGPRPDGSVTANYARNGAVKAADVRRALAAKYGDRRLRDEVLSFLDHMCNVFEKGEIGDRRQSFVCDCALGMITDDDGIEAPIAVVQRIVRVFLVPMWYFPVGNLIGRYLTLTQLLETLMAGIENPTFPDELENCLTGFRLYLGKARPDVDAHSRPLVPRYLERLRELERSDDAEIARLAHDAHRALESHAGSGLS
jgi:hypothetical protein